MLTQGEVPSIRPLTTAEIDTMLGNLVAEMRSPIVPIFVACRVARRGERRDRSKINSPRRKPLFLHLLLVTSLEPGFTPERVWLGDTKLQIDDGWASNPELCDRGANLVRCEAFPGSVPSAVLAQCWDFRGLPPGNVPGNQSYLYLRLEWRRWAFPSGIPLLKAE